MSYSRLILKEGANIVWGLDDLKTETASISMPTTFLDNSASYYNASVNASATNLIGVPVVFGGETALELTSSVNPCITIPALNIFSELYSKNNYAIEFWLKVDKVPDGEITIFKKRNSSNTGLFLRDNYLIYRYGNSSSFIEISYGLSELNEPTHIAMNYNKENIELIVNGISKRLNNDYTINKEVDYSHSINNYIDFYGNSNCSIIVDSIAIYPYCLSTSSCKRHYMYGLGKSIKESVFTNMGGLFFNVANDQTRKSYFQYWNTQDRWFNISLNNLLINQQGINPNKYSEPVLNSLDNKITKSNNQVKFFSISDSEGSYIDFNNLNLLFNEDSSIFMAKFRLEGTPPVSGSYQTLLSLGQTPYTEILNFNLVNNAGNYSIQAYHVDTASTVSFSIASITSSPTIYIGLAYDGQTKIYFSSSGGSIQTASFTTYSGSSYGIDILSSYLLPDSNSILRIGSRYSFDTLSDNTSNINQFVGAFDSIMFLNVDFDGTTYSSIDNYTKYKYKTHFNTIDNRFKVSTFGTASFIIPGSRMVDSNMSGSGYISSNRFEFGYPNSISGSQVQIFVSMYDYNNNLIKSKEKIEKYNFFNWLNLTNIYDKYIKFDIEMLSKDVLFYPPIIKYFKAEAYPYSGSYVDILGYTKSYIRINNGASAQSYIPEYTQTPTVFLTDSSGIRSNKNYVDISFDTLKIGTVGFFVKSNNVSTSTKLLEIFSTSSAASTSLFSASIQSNAITVSSAIGTPIINGGRSSSIKDKEWTHVSFTFNPKLETSSVNSFLFRFGDNLNSDFNIQNIYMLDTLLESVEIAYIHNGFVGGSAVISAISSSSAISLIDRDESRHSGVSASILINADEKQSTNVIFQPFLVQKRFLGEVSAATFLDSSSISNVQQFDGVDFRALPDEKVSKILLLSNNKLYSISKSDGDINVGTEITTIDGDYVRVIDGITNENKIFVKVDGVFTEYPELLKINAFIPDRPLNNTNVVT